MDIDKLSEIFENQSENLMEKVEDIRNILEQLEPYMLLRNLSEELINCPNKSNQIENIINKYELDKFRNSCEICFIKDITISSLKEFINKLDSDMYDLINSEKKLDEGIENDFYDED